MQNYYERFDPKRPPFVGPNNRFIADGYGCIILVGLSLKQCLHICEMQCCCKTAKKIGIYFWRFSW